MLRTLKTIFLGRAARLEADLEQQNAALIIEQKIREAEAGHEAAKASLAGLIARSRSEEKALGLLENRIGDLGARTKSALKAGRSELAHDAAALLAELENERTVRERTLQGARDKAERLRLAVEKTQRRIVDLRQGLITAQAIEKERRSMASLKGSASAKSAITEGEAVLDRLLASEDPIEHIEALEEVEAGLSGASVMDRLAAEGFGKSEKVRAEDVLSRLANDPSTEDPQTPSDRPAAPTPKQ